MRSKSFLGIDNGVTGAVGIVSSEDAPIWFPMPVKKELSYTKAKKFITRIDTITLRRKIATVLNDECFVYIERPMVNPGRFNATLSAMRALEATLIVLEECKLPFQYVDSKEWQKTMFPSGLKGDELKRASIEMAKRIWPKLEIPKGRDADSLLMAEHFRRKQL